MRPPSRQRTRLRPRESITTKRRGTGFHGYDPGRAFPGFTLFAPSAGTNKTVFLIDLKGSVVHSWDMPYPPGSYGYLTDRGTLFYNGKIPNSSHVGQSGFQGGAALEVDWKGRILWEVKRPDHHHDGIRLSNGNVLLLCSASPLSPMRWPPWSAAVEPVPNTTTAR